MYVRVRIQWGPWTVSRSRSGKAKFTHKNRTKLIVLRAEGFSCSLDVLYGGLGISKLQFFLSKNWKKRYTKKISAVFFNYIFLVIKIGSGSVFGSGVTWIAGSWSLLSVLRYKELKKENETLKAELESLETGREELQAVLRIRIHMFLGLLDPDPLVRGMDPDPDPSVIKQI